MALAVPVVGSPSRTSGWHSPHQSRSNSPVRPSSPYGQASSPSKMHSPVVARALQQAAGRLSRSSSGSSVEVQPSANTRSLRQLHAAPFASSSPHSSHLRKGVQSVVAHGGHSNQPVEWNQIRGPANPVSRSTSPPVEFLSPAAAITAVEAELLVLEQPLDRSLHTDGVASPAAVLPSVDLASRPAEQTEAATRAQAAGTATMSVADFDDEPQQEDFWRTPQGQLPDTVALLQFLVDRNMPAETLSKALMQLVKVAAADQMPAAVVMSAQNLQVWQKLLLSEPQVAVLAAEVLCRVCGQDVKPWTSQVTQLLPTLLQVVRQKGCGPAEAGGDENASKQIPLLFFCISALVRLSGTHEMAKQIVQQGGLEVVIEALTIDNPAICQVTTFLLFRLVREIDGDLTDEQLMHWPISAISGSSDTTARALLLVEFVKLGAFPKLCSILGSAGESSAHDMAFTMLLSMSIMPEVAQLVANQNEMQSLAKVLTSTGSGSTRLEVMLIIGRLSARHVPCQQDAVREGVVPALVHLMQQGTDEEKCHAARVLAIVGQHPSTHQIVLDSGALLASLRILKELGYQRVISSIAPAQFHLTSQPTGIWEAAHAIYNSAVAAGLSDAAASSAAAAGVAAAVTETGRSAAVPHVTGSSNSTAARPKPSAAAGAGSDSGVDTDSADSSVAADKAIGPATVLEQAVGVVCALSHNLDNHFIMVGEGAVPLLVSLLRKDVPSKTMAYTLASLLMLAIGESRHAAVISRAGAVPGLVSIAGDAGMQANNREMAAALLAVLCRSLDVQEGVVLSSGIQELTRLIADGSDTGRCYGCEALSQLAAASGARCRQVLRAGVLGPLKAMLQPSSSSRSIMWASTLLQILSREPSCLKEIACTPGLVSSIPDILSRNPQIQSAAPERTSGPTNQSRLSSGSQGAGSSGTTVVPDVDPASPILSNFSDDEISPQPDSRKELEQQQDKDVEKAQASMAWVVAALSTNDDTRLLIAELGSFLVRPLVMILRDSQGNKGSGYTLDEVLQGITYSRQAATGAALQAIGCADDRLAAAINAEIMLQLWMGHRVQLPPIDGSWLLAPSWYEREF